MALPFFFISSPHPYILPPFKEIENKEVFFQKSITRDKKMFSMHPHTKTFPFSPVLLVRRKTKMCRKNKQVGARMESKTAGNRRLPRFYYILFFTPFKLAYSPNTNLCNRTKTKGEPEVHFPCESQINSMVIFWHSFPPLPSIIVTTLIIFAISQKVCYSFQTVVKIIKEVTITNRIRKK